MEVEIIRSLDYEFFHVALRADNLVRIVVKTNDTVEIDLAKEIEDAVDKVRGGSKIALLILANEWSMVSMETRTYLANRQNPDKIAEAYIVKSLAQKLMGNVYLSFNKPIYPTKIFTDEELAITWLKTKF
ncbi:MAG: hypothetical protein ABI315_11015 [Bacteroidia bacterium]